MDRRRFLLTSVAGAVAVPLVAEARQAEKVYRLGVRTLISVPAFEDVFRQSLKDRGYIVLTDMEGPAVKWVVTTAAMSRSLSTAEHCAWERG